MSAADGRLEARVIGEIGATDDGVLVIRRIRVRYRLRVEAGQRETAERVHEVHAHKCPVARSLEGSIAIDTELELAEAAG